MQINQILLTNKSAKLLLIADKHINDNYGLERISKTNHGYNYVYSNDNSTSKQHVSISNQGIITK